MPSRRSPVPIEEASTSKSSATRTLIAPCSQVTGVNRVSAAGTVLAPAPVYNGSMEATIDVIGLRKRFGATRALDGMSFAVGAGRVTGFIGPNGAGKTT